MKILRSALLLVLLTLASFGAALSGNFSWERTTLLDKEIRIEMREKRDEDQSDSDSESPEDNI